MIPRFQLINCIYFFFDKLIPVTETVDATRHPGINSDVFQNEGSDQGITLTSGIKSEHNQSCVFSAIDLLMFSDLKLVKVKLIKNVFKRFKLQLWFSLKAYSYFQFPGFKNSLVDRQGLDRRRRLFIYEHNKLSCQQLFNMQRVRPWLSI